MRSFDMSVAVLVLATTTTGLPAALAGDLESVPAQDVCIEHADACPAETRIIRAAAVQACEFFSRFGIAPRRPVKVRLSDEVLDVELPHIAAYAPATRTVRLASLQRVEAMPASQRLFDLPLDEALYQSVVVHEIAHAIAHQHFAVDKPSLVAQEYIAYVAQLATVEPAVRQRILQRWRLPAYRDIGEMSAVYYALNPSGFGVKAYGHFISLPDPARFLSDLLSGAIAPVESEWE
jgi:hypothetical protein